MGMHLGIDESSFCHEVYTILHNKEGHGRKGTIVAIIKGTKPSMVTAVLNQLPIDSRLRVEDITMDLSPSMGAIARTSFPNAKIVRDLYNTDRKLYHKIKALPMKSRVMRDTGKHQGKTVVFVSSSVKTEFFLADKGKVEAIDFLDAVAYLKAKPEETPAPFTNEEQHYNQVNRAVAKYKAEYVEAASVSSSAKRTDLDKTALEANHFLRTVKQITIDSETRTQCDILTSYINEGVYAQLPRQLKALAREYKNDRERLHKDEYVVQNRIDALCKEYQTFNREQHKAEQDVTDPQIIISETFI